MRKLFILLTALFIISCEKEVDKISEIDSHAKNKNNNQLISDYLNKTEIEIFSNVISTLLNNNRPIREAIVNELLKSDSREVLVYNILQMEVSDGNSRSKVKFKDFLIGNKLLEKKDIEYLCENMIDLELQVFNSDFNNKKSLFANDIELYLVPPHDEKVSLASLDITFYGRNGKSKFKESKEPDYEVLVLTRSEDGVVFDNIRQAEQYALKNEGNLLINDCNKLFFLHKFYSVTASENNGLNSTLLDKRSLCNRDNVTGKEYILQFYTQSIFEGWFQDVGDFAVITAWGVRAPGFTGSPSTTTRRFKFPRVLRNNWVTFGPTAAIDLFTWSDDISRNVKYTWVEEDSGGTITLGGSLGGKFVNSTTANGSTSSGEYTYGITFSYSIKNDHDQVGDCIIKYCDAFQYTNAFGVLGHQISAIPNVRQLNKEL